MKSKKGYTSPTVCLDGKDSHDWEESTMQEEGREIEIKVCSKCGYWE